MKVAIKEGTKCAPCFSSGKLYEVIKCDPERLTVKIFDNSKVLREVKLIASPYLFGKDWGIIIEDRLDLMGSLKQAIEQGNKEEALEVFKMLNELI